MPQISLFSPHSSPIPPMNTIDISKFSDLSFSYDQVLNRLQRLSPTFDLSPTSSVSSSNASTHSKTPQDAFFATRSRVVRLYNLPTMAEAFLAAVFLPRNAMEQPRIPVPATMWELKEVVAAGLRDSVWAVFRTHEEACVALSLSGRAMSVATALECDLEPFHKLHRFVLRGSASNSPAPSSLRNNNNSAILDLPPPLSLPLLRTSSSLFDLQSSYSSPMPENNKVSLGEYTLSSNPPNPKTSFRLGDWICSSPNCAAHNFGRNLACIGCGCPRSNNGNACGSNMHQHQHQHAHQHQSHQAPASSNARAQPSPRFNNMANNVTYYSTGPPPMQTFQSQQQQQLQREQQQQQQRLHVQHPPIGSLQPHPPSPFGASSSSLPQPANPPKSTHPLLTPSGRAFAVGGKVQNISSDPLSPCIMYWPDNEPFPEQGQIRPSGLIGVAQPPILNTGNRGPISHQPGDWICQKCNYLNWRRRKVCQTCLPYAEGNGDSISAAVQAERIALLTSVLSQTQISGGNLNIPGATAQALRSHSLTPPQSRRPFIDLSPPQTTVNVNRSVHRSQSHFSLGQQYTVQQSPAFTASSPIYQTSGNREREPSPLYSTGPTPRRDSNHAVHGLTKSMNNLTVNANGHAYAPQPQSQLNINAISNINHSVPVSLHAPAPLLPSFLQDMVQSPALSPTSTTTSSADLSSVEEYEDFQSPRVAVYPRARGDSGSSDASSAIANIWRLDGEESKSLSAFPLPNHQELIGGRKISGEKLRA